MLAGVLLATRAPAAEAEYRLGPEDKIRLKVFEWRASQDEVFGWEALNDEYSLGAAGELSLPLVGSVQAAGVTRDQLATLISEQLAQNMGLGRAPTVAVEIVAYRPFFIVGPVEAPGAYPFRPGLTLLKALSLAGGLKTSEDGGTRAVISGLGDLDVLLLQRDEVVAKLARLRAELSGADFEAPPNLADRKGDAGVARLIVGAAFRSSPTPMRVKLECTFESEAAGGWNPGGDDDGFFGGGGRDDREFGDPF